MVGSAGPDPDHKSYSSFATFEDPDGNSWLLQEVTERLPGRVDPTITSFNSAGDLARALRRAGPPTASTRSESARQTRIGPTGTPSIWCVSKPVRSCLRERFRCDRAGRRCTRRALRGRHRGAGASGRSGRARAGRRRVLLLGVHPLQVALAPGGGSPGGARRRRQRPGGRAGDAGLAGLHGVRLFGCGTGTMAGGPGHLAHPWRGPTRRVRRGRGERRPAYC